MQLFAQRRSIYGKCQGRAHLLDQVCHQNRFRRETECGKFGLDYNIIIKVWYCAYCVQPYLLDLVSLVALQICMEEEHERNIRMHVYTYALRGGEVTYLHGIVNKPDCMGHSIQVFIKRDT